MARRTRANLSRPQIGVTGNSRRYSPSWYCLRWSVWLAGGRAIRIRVGHPANLAELSGIIISGGDDIHPTLYGQEPQERARYDRARDSLEISCIRYAISHQLPLFGICRGYQLINAVLGGTLFTDIKKMRNITSDRRTLMPKKLVTIQPPSSLAKIIGKSQIRVNSLHDQAIALVAPGLSGVAVDCDDILQAVEAGGGKPLMGVQWHPEYLWFLPGHFQLFRWLIGEARSVIGRC